MKILIITGCLGLIGSHVTRKCLERNWIVYGIDNLTYAANINFLEEFKKNKNFIFSKEDICDVKLLPDCDYVINIAAESHVGNSIIDSKEFTKTNVLGVQNLLELIRHKPSNVSEKPTFLHFSTDEVYGDIVDGFHKETDILKPSNPYAASKAAADMLVLAWSRTYNIDYVIVRPTNNYGYGQYPEKLIPLTVKLLQRNKKVRLHDEGKPIRNWLHSDDTAEAILKIIDNNVRNEIFNISGNFEQTNKDTVEKVIKSFFNSDTIDLSKYIDVSYKRPGQDVRYAIDDSKIKNIGWEPIKVFDDEISNIVNYYKNNMKL